MQFFYAQMQYFNTVDTTNLGSYLFQIFANVKLSSGIKYNLDFLSTITNWATFEQKTV